MKAFVPILFWVLAGLGLAMFMSAKRLHQRIMEEEPDLSEEDAISRAFRTRPADFEDPESRRLARWTWRFGTGFVAGFLLWISMAFWAR